MNTDTITIGDLGLEFFGTPAGFAPKIEDIERVVRGESVRICSTSNCERQIRIWDSKGLSWLVDLDRGVVLVLRILLAPLTRKKGAETQPLDVYTGLVHIGGHKVQGPNSTDTGEIIRKIVIPRLGLVLVPERKRICALLIGFTENE